METRSIEAIVRALNDGNVQYLIVGGLAVNAHGFERLTRDLDLVIGLEADNISRGFRILIGIGYTPSIPVTAKDFADAANREMWRRDKNMLVLKLWSDTHQRTPIDLFVWVRRRFDVAIQSTRKNLAQISPSQRRIGLKTL